MTRRLLKDCYGNRFSWYTAIKTTVFYHRGLIKRVLRSKQELSLVSYRQQIARQLRTQYAEGIYRHNYYTVTLKPRLRVTQGHWKRNHWIDHTRLSSSRVI